MVEKLPVSRTAHYLGDQLLRSGISPALNYSEAKSAESKNDFVHKMKICLKELRESHTCMKIISRFVLVKDKDALNQYITECNELISIFVKSIDTASKS